MSILFDVHEDPTTEQQTKKSRARNQQDERYPTHQSTDNYDDILIFGYQCKMFRDDQTAEELNNGKFLIPWMGNKELMIDRYDCRGHLYRIEEFDFESMAAFPPLSPDRLDVENVCDEERYMDLHKDMNEENILLEEEDKRGSALYDPFTAYQNIEYSYEDSSEGKKLSEVTAATAAASEPSADSTAPAVDSASTDSTFNKEMYLQFCQYYGYDPNNETLKTYFQSQSQNPNPYQYDYERPPPPSEPPPSTSPVVYSAEPVSAASAAAPAVAAPTYKKFKPPEGIEFPDGMEMPETRKMQQIIDKTALFISKQSAQMEIVLKTKQSGNPQFAFLDFDNYLNPYYKFILGKIKSGEYQYVDDAKTSDAEDNDTSKTEDDNEDSNQQQDMKLENENGDSGEESDGDENELHPLLQAHRRPLNNQSVPSPPPTASLEVEEDEPIINHVPQTKMTGKVEDLAKVYMQWKYTPNPSEATQGDDMEEDDDEEENDDSALPNDEEALSLVNDLPPPPLPPPPSFMLPGNEHSDKLAHSQPDIVETLQQSYDPEHPTEHLQLMHGALHGSPIFRRPMLPPPLPPPPSLRQSHFPPLRPPQFPLPQGFPNMPRHFLTVPFQHTPQSSQFSHPPELYQVRSSVPPPPPPPLPSLLPPGVDAPPVPTFTSTCTDGTIFDVGPPPLLPIPNHVSTSLIPAPIVSNTAEPLSTSDSLLPHSAEGLLPPGVETEEKPAVPPPPPPPLPPNLGLFSHSEQEEGADTSLSLDNGDCSNNNNNNNVSNRHVMSNEETPHTDLSEKEDTFYREHKRRKRTSNNIDNKMDSGSSSDTTPEHSNIPSDSSNNSPSSSSQPSSTSSSSVYPTKIVTPGKDLQLVIDRLSLYVVKNGEEFEVGIKEKNDPRFDFLNPWNAFHPYYMNKKRLNHEAVEGKKRKEEERRKNIKVKFDMKTKLKPVAVATKKKTATTASVFNQNEDEDETDGAEAPAEGFQPNVDPEVEVKRKLQKQIEEKEKLLKQLHEQASLQQKVTEVNKQAGNKPMLQNLTIQQQALLKKKVQTDNALNAKQEDRKKRAATFVGQLKKNAEANNEPTPMNQFLRKRQFKETSGCNDESTKQAADRAAYEKKKDAFFKAINDAFKGGTSS